MKTHLTYAKFNDKSKGSGFRAKNGAPFELKAKTSIFQIEIWVNKAVSTFYIKEKVEIMTDI